MIVDAARRLAADGGLAAVSMEAIASEVGITAGGLYRHFPGKTAIAGAVRIETIEHFVDLADRASQSAAPGGEAAAIVAATVASTLDDPSLLRFYMREWGALADGRITTAERRLVRLWTDAVRAARPQVSRAHARVRQAGVMGALAGTSRMASIHRPRSDVLLGRACTAVLLRAPVPVADQSAPIPPGADWKPPASRRDEIMSAALRLFRVRGFAGTTVDDIGQAVGLAGSGIYRSFPSKAEILLDAYDRTAARVEVGVDAALAAAADPLDAIRRMTSSYARIALDNTDLIVVTGRESSGLPPQERARIARRNRGLRDAWVPVVRQVRDDLSEPEARMLYRGALALANQAALFPEKEPLGPGTVADLMMAFLLSATSISGQEAT
jgi:AcrR family transcriptional regulator